MPPPHTCVASPTRVVYVLPLMNLHYASSSPEVHRLGFGVVHSQDFGKCLMSCIHHCSLSQRSFTARKFSVLCLFILPSPQSLATTGLFTVSVVLLFPECHVVEVRQQAAFSDRLLSLSIQFQFVKFEVSYAILFLL